MRISVTVSIMASQDAKELPLALTITLFSFCPYGTKRERDYVIPCDRPSPNLDTPFILHLVLFHFFILSASQPIFFCPNNIMYH